MGKKIQLIGKYVMDGVVLGKGNFAHVELATHETTEIKVAVKIIDTRKIKDEYLRANLHREARIMASLRHPNVIRLYETLKVNVQNNVYKRGGQINEKGSVLLSSEKIKATTLYCLVTEYAAGGELLAYIKSRKDCKLGENASRPFIRQLISALHYLHERNIVHRDLKMENIMLDEKKKNIKLIDFGLSNIYKPDDPLKTHCGSPEYAAPELFIVCKTYGPEVDIWSLGVIMYAMILGRLPFCTPFRDEYHQQRMLQQIQKGLSTTHDREMQGLTPDCRNLLHQLIEPNPELRIPLPEMEIHPWITKNGKCPFYYYVPPPRNKNLRNQVIGALSIMMDMKRGILNETVKENRADELSAMYNMMMDHKKKQLGLFDIDHTKKPYPDRTARSRSADRDKSQTPESTRGKVPALLKKPAANAATNKKTNATSKAKPKNKPAGAAKEGAMGASTACLQAGPGGMAPGVQAGGPGQSNRLDVVDPNRTLGRPVTPNGNSRSKLPGQLRPPGAPPGPAGDPNASNGPTRIPLSQRRVPPPKLSLTLDLSVTNPGASLRQEKLESILGGSRRGGARRDQVTDSSYGIAASSGVPPRLSPKESAQPSNSTSSRPSNAAASRVVKTVSIVQPAGATRARRPSSLQYSLKSAGSKRLSISRSSLIPSSVLESRKHSAVEAVQEEPEPVEEVKKVPVMAPTATPEDSQLDSCSTEEDSSEAADPDEDYDLEGYAAGVSSRFLDSLAEAVASSQSEEELDDEDVNAMQDDLLKKVSRRSDGSSLYREQHASPMPEALKSTAGKTNNEVSKGLHSLSPRGSINKPDITYRTNQSIDGVRQNNTDNHSRRTKTFAIIEDSKPYSNATTQECDDTPCSLSGSGSSLPPSYYDAIMLKSDDSESSLPTVINMSLSDTDTLVGGSECGMLNIKNSPPAKNLIKESLSLTFSSNISDSDNSWDPQDGGNEATTPKGQTYGKFSHSGAHALDLFFSPDDASSPTGPLWCPLARSSNMQSIQTRKLGLSSANRRQYDARRTLITPATNIQITPFISALDAVSDEEEEEEDDDDDDDDDVGDVAEWTSKIENTIPEGTSGLSVIREQHPASNSEMSAVKKSGNSSNQNDHSKDNHLPKHAQAPEASNDRYKSSTRRNKYKICKRITDKFHHRHVLSSPETSECENNESEMSPNQTSTVLLDSVTATTPKTDGMSVSTDTDCKVRPKTRRAIPILSNLIHRERKSAGGSLERSSSNESERRLSIKKKEDKRIVKDRGDGDHTPQVKDPGTDSGCRSEIRPSPSWRRGLSHWWQASRAGTSPVTVSSTNNNINPSHHKIGGTGNNNSTKSTPMSISLISNHGRKSSLTVPNNYIRSASHDLFRQSSVDDELTEDTLARIEKSNNIEPSTLTVRRSPARMLQAHVSSLLEVVDARRHSGPSKSPLARLKARKVQWEECQKCKHSDHSSDEGPETLSGGCRRVGSAKERRSGSNLLQDDSSSQASSNNINPPVRRRNS